MLIECSNITKSFQGIPLLKDITFKIDDHDKVAIIGVNGAGKLQYSKLFLVKKNMIMVIFFVIKNYLWDI